MENTNFIRRCVSTFILIWLSLVLNGQTLPVERSTNWKIAGLKDTSTVGFQNIDVLSLGITGDGITPNDTALMFIISSLPATGSILHFPEGNFLFNHSITLPSNIIIRGSGATSTIFTMNLQGQGNSFNIHGAICNADTTALYQPSFRDSSSIIVENSTHFTPNDWIQISQIDTDLVTSSWAYQTVGQIVQISSIEDSKIYLASPLRMDYITSRHPKIKKISPIQNIGIECITIIRIDSTAPSQSSNINYLYAVNCWVHAIESNNCTFAHIDASVSSNLEISKNYFHHAFHYGDNGRAYGVVLNATTNECRVEDNIFNHLRHSMILQSGANGNVFGYNYSINPIWETSSPFLPTNSAGDIVLHGNYPYANLFEGNVCQNIVIDDSHGPNGSYNTFFRNKADGFGIFFSASNSPNQNFIGNDITNTTSPYNIVNYTIQGTGHFLYGNNNKGAIVPTGTESLPESTLGYNTPPLFMPPNLWNSIGTPNVLGSGSNDAQDRYLSNDLFRNSCGNSNVKVEKYPNIIVDIFPNPMREHLYIKSLQQIIKVDIYNNHGQIVKTSNGGYCASIDVSSWSKGIYFIVITFSNGEIAITKGIKAE